MWFAQVDHKFSSHRISSQTTRFKNTVVALPLEVAQEVRDILLNPPSDDPYDILKVMLIKRLEASEE